MKGISWRAYGIGFLAACAILLFLRSPLFHRFTAQTGGEDACDNMDNNGTGVVDEGCSSCKADERFVVGNRTYCFSFASFGIDLSAADAECRSFGGSLASYTDGETRADLMEIMAKYASIAYKQPVFPQALLIKNTCKEMTTAFPPPDDEMYADSGFGDPGAMDCSHPVIMHSGSEGGRLNDGTGGAGDGAVCEIMSMSGWCCVTDGQACVPMTLVQCDASGIGFARDQATCNVLCGVISSSSSRSSSSVSSISSVSSSSSPPSSPSSGSPSSGAPSSGSPSSGSPSSGSLSSKSSSSSLPSSSSSSSSLPSSVSSFKSISSTPISHTYCNAEKACKSMSGPGTNQCAADADCAKTTHLGCLRMDCRILGGAGSDLCTKDSDCLFTHTVCQFNQCIERPGIGIAQCTTDADCAASSSARSSSSSFSTLPQCGDGKDNDGDGKKDFPADPGCFSPSDESEADGPRLPQCSDGLDNDGDAWIDGLDPGCHWDADPNNPFSYNPGDDEWDVISLSSSSRPSDIAGTDVILSLPPLFLEEPALPTSSAVLSALPVPTLPFVAPVCGDGLCAPQENAGSCPADCVPVEAACERNEQCDTGLCRDSACRLCDSDCDGNAVCLLGRCLPRAPSPSSILAEVSMQREVTSSPQISKLRAPAQPGSGPELLAIMAAGTAGGWAWMRRRRTTPSLPHIAR